MGAISLVEFEPVLVDLAEEVALQPSLTVLDLSLAREHSDQPLILTVRTHDVLLAGNGKNPQIMILGHPRDMVQLADHRTAGPKKGLWIFADGEAETPGFRSCTHWENGNMFRLLVQKNLEIYDADGVRV